MRSLRITTAALLLAFLVATLASAQQTINGSRNILGNWDASGANTTKSCKVVNTAGIPSTCAVGECLFVSDATAGQNGRFCTATDTWTAIAATIAADSVTLGTHTTGNYVQSVATTGPLSGGAAGSEGAALTLSIANAAADGSTKGAASFTAADFDAASGNVSIDYTNGQAASGSTKGFLTSADYTTFNNKLGGIAATGGTATGPTVTLVDGVGIASTRSSNNITIASTRYTATATATTSLTVTGATHGIGSANLRVTCYDNSSPRKMVEPDSVTIDDSTKDVVITFFVAQTGKCYIE